jgi:DNA-binding transcriptional ArsR family regulator
MEALQERLQALERRVGELEHIQGPRTPAWGRIKRVPTPPRVDGSLFPAVRQLIATADGAHASGEMSFVGFHRTNDAETSRMFQWQLDRIGTSDVLAMDDARNVKVLSALAHPVRLRMMKAILERPATAADLRERLGLTSTGQTYHALKALENGGMIEQEPDGTFVAIGDKACGFLILLAGLYNLTEGKYDPAFVDTVIEDEPVTDETGSL